MFLDSLWGAAASAALVAGVSWCPSCRKVTGPKFLHQLDTIFSPCITTTTGIRTLYSMLCWESVSRSSLGKCQSLTYIKSCICWAVQL